MEVTISGAVKVSRLLVVVSVAAVRLLSPLTLRGLNVGLGDVVADDEAEGGIRGWR